MIIAIYRIHYGLDYLKHSINSIIDYVDRVYIYYSLKPWISSEFIQYKNQKIQFPKNPEQVEKFLNDNYKNNHKVFFENYECSTPKNQFGNLYKLTSQKCNLNIKYVLFLEPDMIFFKNGLKLFIKEFKLRFWLNNLSSREIEIWKYEELKNQNYIYKTQRNKRPGGGVIIWRTNKNIETDFSPKGKGAKLNYSYFTTTLNMGYSLNNSTIYYKFLLSLLYSSKIGDSIVNENWFEEKWVNWNERTTNLEPSLKAEHKIKKAVKYKLSKKEMYYL